jgi:DNA-binding transcriptional LysR family regulator
MSVFAWPTKFRAGVFMNMNQIEAFLETVRLENMSAAARKLHMSQPAVTQQIKRLEGELNCRLIKNEKRKFILTPEGKAFLHYAEYMHLETQNCMMDIARIQKGMTGSLNFITTQIAGEYVLPPILNEFKSSYTFLDVKVEIADFPQVVENVGNANDIFGFVGVLPLNERNRHEMSESIFSRSDIEKIKVGEDEQVFIAYSGHPLALKKELASSDIIGEPLILKEIPRFGDLSSIGINLENYRPKIIMGTTEGVLSAVEAKLGIGIISRLIIGKSEAMGLVKVLNVKHFRAERELYCIYKKAESRTVLVQNFIQFLKERPHPKPRNKF